MEKLFIYKNKAHYEEEKEGGGGGTKKLHERACV